MNHKGDKYIMIVTIYTLPNCGRCCVLKEKLTNSGITYKEEDANEHLSMLKSHNIFSAPALLTDDGLLMNFSQACKWLNQIGG